MSKIGDNILCLCNKCKMILSHMVSAAVDEKPIYIICNTCKTRHKYNKRKDPSITKIKYNSSDKKEKKLSSIYSKDIHDKKKKYNLRSNYSVGDVIEHPEFGVGVVRHKTSTNIEVYFKHGTKILIHCLNM